MRKSFRTTAAVVSAMLAIQPAVITAFAEGNPYRGGWSNCTWSAWQLTYDKLGIALPGMGNAYEWYSNAAARGYSVGSTPAANSIVVWSAGRMGLGHVAYVDYVNDDGSIFIEEGGNSGAYAARTVYPTSAGSLKLTGYIYLGDSADVITYADTQSYTLSATQTSAVNSALHNAVAAHVPKVSLTDSNDTETGKAPNVTSEPQSHYVVLGDQAVDYTVDGADDEIDSNEIVVAIPSDDPDE